MEWHKNLKIRSKLLIASGMLVLLMAFSNTITIIQFLRASRSYNFLINDTMKRQIYLLDAKTDIMKLRHYNLTIMYLFSVGLSAEEIDNLNLNNIRDKLLESFINNMNSYNDSVISDTDLSAEEKMQRMNIWNQIVDSFINDYTNFTNAIDEIVKNTDIQRANEIIPPMYDTGNYINAKLDDLTDFTINKVKNDSVIAVARNKNAINILLGITGCFVVFVIFLTFVISATIRNPVLRMQKAMAEISRGNLSYPIRSEQKDELGMLSNSIGDMVDTIAEMNKTMAIIDYLDCMIYIVDMDYRIIYLNNKMAEIFGIDKEDIMNKRCYKHLKDLVRPCDHCVLQRILAEKNYTYSEDIEFLWDEKINKWLDGKAAVIRW
jgi:PAS domain-containing protein